MNAPLSFSSSPSLLLSLPLPAKVPEADADAVPPFLQPTVAIAEARSAHASALVAQECARHLMASTMAEVDRLARWELDARQHAVEKQIADPFEKLAAASRWYEEQGYPTFLHGDEEDQLRYYAKLVRAFRKENVAPAFSTDDAAGIADLTTRYATALQARVRYPRCRRDRDGHLDEDETEADYGLVVIAALGER